MGATRDVAVLLTSVIVINAFLHGRSAAQVNVTSVPGRLPVEVLDNNARLPQLVTQDREALGERGLAIVDTLATAWVSRSHTHGKLVWFELRLP